MKKRPFGATLLAILAVIAAIVAGYVTLQLLDIIPISGPFGIFDFFGVEWLGAIMWGVLVLIYLWVARMLWNVDPQGWIFVAALSALNLILAVLAILGDSSWEAMLPSLIINGVILLYCLLPGTKEAFNVPSA